MALIVLQQTDQDIIQVMGLVLRLEGFDVRLFKGFPDGLADMIAAAKPDLVLLDHYLDGKDCLAVLRALRAKDLHMPVLVSGCSAQVPGFSARHGFDSCLELPFDLTEFYETITAALPK